MKITGRRFGIAGYSHGIYVTKMMGVEFSRYVQSSANNFKSIVAS